MERYSKMHLQRFANNFQEMCLPGGPIVPIPSRTVLHPARDCQIPYRAKIRFVQIESNYIEFLIDSAMGPLKGPHEIWYLNVSTFTEAWSTITKDVTEAQL